MIIIRVKIVNDISGFLPGNVVDPVVFQELHDFFGRNKLIAGIPIQSLKRDIWPSNEGPLILVELCESLS